MDSLPLSPGVYWFLDETGNVLYVGKAKELKKRLRQYAHAQDERPHIALLSSEIHSVSWNEEPSELQALLVEAELIRRYQPRYNILLKDDKSDLYICISKDEFPKIFTARKPEILRSTQKLVTFGPFPSAYKVRQVLEVARTIFKWCDKPSDSSQFVANTRRPCFYYHINLCDGACIGMCTQEEYKQKMNDVKEFLRGKTSQLIKEYKQQIEVYSSHREFEKAALTRDQLETLIHVTSPKYRLAPDLVLPILTHNKKQEALVSLRAVLRQYINLPATLPLTRIEGYDVSNIQGTNPTCSMVVAINGMMTNSEYKHFSIRGLNTPNDYAMLKETLSRRQNHPEWGIPDLVLIDGGKGQLRIALSVWRWPSIVVSIAKKPDRLLIPILQDTTAKRGKAIVPSITYKEIHLTPDLPASQLLQHMRDESHRFAKRLHTIKRTKSMVS